MYVLNGICALFGLTLLVLLVVSCFTKKAEPQPTRAGTPNVDGAAGWGPFGFLFPRSWVFVWWGYLAMLLFSSIILPNILDALPSIYSSPDAMQQSETLETILSIGPFIHCVLMPFLWTHKHRQVKKRIENQRDAEVVETSELDPEAKTVIFSMKLGCGQRCKILLVDMTMGLVEFVLWCIKRGSLGTVNLSAYWFPSPFYSFWKAKMHIGLLQINGAKICTTANQSDAYMKFVTEAMLNFWTFGIYGKCCSGRTSYGRWLDRHVLWQGAPPRGYNNQFRIFDEKLACSQLVKVYLFGLLLSLCGGCLYMIPIVGGLWPFGLALPWYMYTVKLDNMKFGGADPTFVKEFTWCNYIYKYYTIGICGLCGQPVKVWVDKCIVMGEPTFDKDMANRDSQADSANPNELSERFTNQSTSGAQTMSVQVPQGLQGGMPMPVQTPGGVMQVQIPAGLQPGTAFQIQVPASVALTAVNLGFVPTGHELGSSQTDSLATSQANDLERGGGAPATEAAAPESLAALLAACGLQHHEKAFKAEGYTLDNLLSSMKQGEDVAKRDLRELKLTLGECRLLLNQLGSLTKGPPAQPMAQAQPAMQKMSVQVPQGLQGGMPMQVQTPGGVMQVQIPAGQQPGTAFEIQVPRSNDPSLPSATSKVDTKAEEKAAAAAAKQAAATKATEEKAAAAAAKKLAAQEAAAEKASAKKATAQEAVAAKATEGPSVGNQVIMWLTETCDINASDAKLYADAFAELGIDTPEDLHMIDGDEVAWPSIVKPVHRKKIKAGLESTRTTPVGRKMSDTI